jgi:hypothetical protein
MAESASLWELACDDVAEDLLAQGGIHVPPVDALELAARLDLPVAFDELQSGRGRLKRLAGRPAIFIRPEERQERLQWSVAHEIGEACAHRVFARIGCDADEVPPGRREQVANVMASRLLLPGEWFLRDARLLDGDVPLLKQSYATASHELILLNLLRLPELTLVTVFDHGAVTRRRGNGQLAPPPLLPAERDVLRRVRERELPVELTAAGVRIQGWPVYEPGWNRELLRTTALGDSCGMGDDMDDGGEWCE